MLVTLAEARQAPLNSTTLRVYDARLQKFALEDVQAAAQRLMETPRRDGETAFPDLPTLLAEVRQAEKRRLSMWVKCPACSAGNDGWMPVYAGEGKGRTRIGVVRCECWKAWKAKQRGGSA